MRGLRYARSPRRDVRIVGPVLYLTDVVEVELAKYWHLNTSWPGARYSLVEYCWSEFQPFTTKWWLTIDQEGKRMGRRTVYVTAHTRGPCTAHASPPANSTDCSRSDVLIGWRTYLFVASSEKPLDLSRRK